MKLRSAQHSFRGTIPRTTAPSCTACVAPRFPTLVLLICHMICDLNSSCIVPIPEPSTKRPPNCHTSLLRSLRHTLRSNCCLSPPSPDFAPHPKRILITLTSTSQSYLLQAPPSHLFPLSFTTPAWPHLSITNVTVKGLSLRGPGKGELVERDLDSDSEAMPVHTSWHLSSLS